MSGSTGYNFSPDTLIRSSEVNQNFEWFRGHYLPITQSGTWLNTTGIYDLGSTTYRFRDLWLSGKLQSGTIPSSLVDIDAGLRQGALKTSTGSTTVTTDNVDVTMNDYSFFPSFTNPTIGFGWSCQIVSDPNTTVGRFRTTGSTTASTKVAWRYITASDDPTIWITYELAGTIVATWMSDDPTPGDIPGVECPGCTSIKIGRTMLNILMNSVSKANQDYAKKRATTPDKEAFHAISKEWPNAGGEIIKRCKINPLTQSLELK